MPCKVPIPGPKPDIEAYAESMGLDPDVDDEDGLLVGTREVAGVD